MGRDVWRVVLATLALVTAGLAPALAEEGGVPAGRPVIGIADFQVADGAVPYEFRESAGRLCADTLAVVLGNTGLFDVVDRTRMNQTLSELKLGMSGLVDPSKAAEVGKMLAAKTIIVGTVLSIELKKGTVGTALEIGGRLGGLLGAAGRAKGASAVAKVSYQVIDVESAKVLATHVITQETTQVKAAESTSARRDLVESALTRTALEFARLFLPKPRGFIAKVDKDAGIITITLGSQNGVTPTMLFRVFRKGEEVKHPVTGEVLDVQYTDLCYAMANAAGLRERVATLTVGELTKGKTGAFQAKPSLAQGLQVGDLVEAVDPDAKPDGK
ncbi:MAG: CsgG/HfaB family protein [Armatimonadota bacterium]|nr:CsgG/HfaB family protein [Armatimonadota bacterium]